MEDFFKIFPESHSFSQFLLNDFIVRQPTPENIPVLQHIQEQIQSLNLPVRFLPIQDINNPESLVNRNVIFLLPSIYRSPQQPNVESIAVMQTLTLAYP